MLRVAVPLRQVARQSLRTRKLIRCASTAPTSQQNNSIQDSDTSSWNPRLELPPRFSNLKRGLIGDNGEAILESWHRLLKYLKTESLPRIKDASSQGVPEVEFSSILESGGHLPEKSTEALKKCGTIVVRQVIPEEQALYWEKSVRTYMDQNSPQDEFAAESSRNSDVYWSKAQAEARSHNNVLLTQAALNRVWQSSPTDRVVLSEPISYCDTLSFSAPRHKSLKVDTHLDGGSLERWEEPEYRKCYTQIFQGSWEKHESFDVSPRLSVDFNMYHDPQGCSAFRTYQGWLSLSHPRQGSLRVMPDLKASTAYTLLRPFVCPRPGSWELDTTSSFFYGATMGGAQQLLHSLHPHIIPDGLVSVPQLNPGDAVLWHCDVVHMIEDQDLGDCVLRIPSAPLCDVNINYLKRQRETFLGGSPPPDFSGFDESEYIGRASVDDVSEEGKRAMGLTPFADIQPQTKGEAAVYKTANEALGYHQ